MKKAILFLLPLLLLFFASINFGFHNTQMQEKEVSGLPSPSPVKTNYNKEEVFTDFPPAASSLYKLQSYNEHLALFKEFGDGSEVLLEEYNVNLSTLREKDILLLSEGITFSSRREAEETLENFMN